MPGAGEGAESIRVEVAWAGPDRQIVLAVDLPAGATVGEAIEASAISERVPGIELHPSRIGIFGRKVKLDDKVRAGDRVEIYRPLQADPKEIRRQRARRQQRNEGQ